MQNRSQSLMAKVSSIIHQGSWRWPRTKKNPSIKSIIAHTPVDFLPNVNCTPDSVVWNLIRNGLFFSIMPLKRPIHSIILWWRIVWSPHHVLRWAFIESPIF